MATVTPITAAVATTTSRSERHSVSIAGRRLLAAGLLVLLALGACRERTSTPQAQPVRPPPSAPADLIFEGTLGEPEAFHLALRTPMVPAALAPHWASTAVALMDLPRGVGERLDPKGPLLVAGVGSKASIVPVYAARVLSGEEIVALLTLGNAAPRRAQRRPDGVVLLPEAGAGKAASALAVVDRFVLASPSADALERSAAYVARSLSRRADEARGLWLSTPKAALAGPLRALLAERWSLGRAELERAARELARERGRAADFAEPAAVLGIVDGAVRELLEVIASSRALSMSVQPFDERLELTLELQPEDAGAALARANALRLGDLDALAALPAESTLAVSWRPVPAQGDAAEAGELLRALFGARLSARDAERASAWFARAERDAPAVRAWSLLADRTVVYREELAPGGPGTDLGAAVALLDLPAFGEPFAQVFGEPAGALRSVTPGGSAVRLEPRARSGSSKPGELVWSQGDGVATLAIGPSARTVVEMASRAAAEKRGLYLDPALRARHEPAAFALHAELSRLGLGGVSAPVLLSLTRRERAISLRLELSRGATRALLERILRR